MNQKIGDIFFTLALTWRAVLHILRPTSISKWGCYCPACREAFNDRYADLAVRNVKAHAVRVELSDVRAQYARAQEELSQLRASLAVSGGMKEGS